MLARVECTSATYLLHKSAGNLHVILELGNFRVVLGVGHGQQPLQQLASESSMRSHLVARLGARASCTLSMMSMALAPACWALKACSTRCQQTAE